MLIAAIATGLLSALLVNYLADVLPLHRRLARPAWWPLTPESIGAYIHAPRKFVVHVVLLLAFVYIFQNPPADFSPYLLTVVLAYFALVTVIDIEHRLVLHPVSLFGALALGALGAWRHGLLPTLGGGAAGFLLMLGLYFSGELIGRLLARLRRQAWEEVALGFGDVNLAGVIGLLLGWPAILPGLMAGILLAGAYSLGFVFVSLMRGRYSLFASIPYAPFLCLGAVALVLLGLYP
ncbi:MAG: prepilin peptidase [Anaerolineales bacterium]|jgi:leader peptidase (prepilin peptidase)/N-methyltransferase|nr:prepilin peptidase [Anaerolineales bacterium]